MALNPECKYQVGRYKQDYDRMKRQKEWGKYKKKYIFKKAVLFSSGGSPSHILEPPGHHGDKFLSPHFTLQHLLNVQASTFLKTTQSFFLEVFDSTAFLWFVGGKVLKKAPLEKS